MFKKTKKLNFEQTLASLLANGFEEVILTEESSTPETYGVSKYGVAAVLGAGVGAVVRILDGPGLLVRGEIAHLLDRGYQKFFQTEEFEIPATSIQLEAIHRFTEELKQLTGETSLYNESLGTTSDLYQYDRLKGREAAKPGGARPWELTAGH